MKVIDNIQPPSLLAVQSHSDSQLLTDGRLEGLELMHTLDNIQQPANTLFFENAALYSCCAEHPLHISTFGKSA